jgi:hypothetical protein
MIQRIQSLFLLVIPLVIIAMFFFPLATFHSAEASFSLWMTGFIISEGTTSFNIQTWFIPAIGILLALLAIVVIFLYRNRMMQLKLNRIVSIASILFVAALFFTVDKTVKVTELSTYAYNIGAYLSLVPPFMIYLANSRIRRDEMKVRAADRIR